MSRDSTDLAELFRDELRLCHLNPEELLLIFTDPLFQYPEYSEAAFEAAQALGARVGLLKVPSGSDLSSEFIKEAWKSADLVLGLTTIPWLYTYAHNEALAHGTRTLLVEQHVSTLKRMFPCKEVMDLTYRGARIMATARQLRITDDAGSDFVLRKDGRKGHAQVGVADRPGRWDHWPSGLVACAPIEDSAQGTYMVNPGDVLLHLRRHVESPVRLVLRDGLVTSIDGGVDAALLRDHLDGFGDPAAYRISHAGWGTDHRADWAVLGMDSESYRGNVMVSLGSNIFDGGEEHSGLGGTNVTTAHFDICCRNKSLRLDDQPVVERGAIVYPSSA